MLTHRGTTTSTQQEPARQLGVKLCERSRKARRRSCLKPEVSLLRDELRGEDDHRQRRIQRKSGGGKKSRAGVEVGRRKEKQKVSDRMAENKGSGESNIEMEQTRALNTHKKRKWQGAAQRRR